MSEKLKRWNGSEWVEVLSINRVEVQGGSGGSCETGMFEFAISITDSFKGELFYFVDLGVYEWV